MTTPFTLRDGGLVDFDDPWLLHFEAEDGSDEDWGRLEEEDDLHAAYQFNGSSYVVTKYEPKEAPPLEDDLDWFSHPSLTVQERNPSLR